MRRKADHSQLREADVELAEGTAVKQVCRQFNITDKGCWREYGGWEVNQAKRMKMPEAANSPPRSRRNRLAGSLECDSPPIRTAHYPTFPLQRSSLLAPAADGAYHLDPTREPRLACWSLP
jgi:hypothetical protein